MCRSVRVRLCVCVYVCVLEFAAAECQSLAEQARRGGAHTCKLEEYLRRRGREDVGVGVGVGVGVP